MARPTVVVAGRGCLPPLPLRVPLMLLAVAALCCCLPLPAAVVACCMRCCFCLRRCCPMPVLLLLLAPSLLTTATPALVPAGHGAVQRPSCGSPGVSGVASARVAACGLQRPPVAVVGFQQPNPLPSAVVPSRMGERVWEEEDLVPTSVSAQQFARATCTRQVGHPC